MNNIFDKDFYGVLGINQASSLDDVKSKYRELAKQYHPDKNPNNPSAEEKFKQVVEAYEVLSNKDKRSDYDFYKRQKDEQKKYASSYNPNFNSNQSGYGFYQNPGYDFDAYARKAQQQEDMFWENLRKSQAEEQRQYESEKRKRMDEQYYNIHKDYYETYRVYEETKKAFHNEQKTEKKVKVKHGSDIKINVDLTENEFRNGVDKKILIEKFVICGMCEGTGSLLKKESWTICPTCFGVGAGCKSCLGEGVTLEKKCNVCGGEGRMEKKVMERIVIPANCRRGQKYIYRNKGDYGIRNNKSGNLIIEIGGLSKTNFDIYKNDIMMYKTIDLDTAVFGGIIEVNNMEKIFKVNVKPGIKSGDIYKIDKMGMVNENKKVVGDYYIKFKVL